MRKTGLLFGLLFFGSLTGFSQFEYFGSPELLKQKLQRATSDTAKLHLYVQLSNSYVFSYPDTALLYGQRGLRLAQQANDPTWIGFNRLSVAQSFIVMGNYPTAIEIVLQALPIFERQRDTVGLIFSNLILSWAQRDAGDARRALPYAKNAARYARAANDRFPLQIAYEHQTGEYEQLKEFDSALFYGTEALKLQDTMRSEWHGIYRTLAMVYFGKQQYDLALHYYQMTIAPSLKVGFLFDVLDAYTGIAQVYQHVGTLDSSTFYANKALHEYVGVPKLDARLKAARLLAQIYQRQKRLDSALKYTQLSIAFKDSLSSQEKVKAIQNVFLTEQFRQQEIQQQQTYYKNKVRTYVLIGGLVVLLLVAGLLYRNNKHKQKANALLQKQKQEIEKQNRDLEIEAALERVRARTMAMQRSEELSEVATILFRQVKALGIPQWTCGFCIWDIGDTECVWYPGGPESEILASSRFPLTEHAVFRIMDESRRRGDELYILEKVGELQESHYRYLMTLPGVRELLQGMLDAGLSIPAFQIDHYVNFAYGNLIFITYEHFPEMHDIFKRFAKVFEQTYTRFLDLQKAEAQAREAKIEAALERVRARTMAMQKSDELSETAYILLQQLKSLGEAPDQITIALIDEAAATLDIFLTMDGNQVNHRVKAPIHAAPLFSAMYRGWKQEETSLVIELSGEELGEWMTYRNNLYTSHNIAVEQKPLETKRIIHVSYFVKGWITFSTLDTRPPNTIALLQRFTQVFNGTYTRFLDLQRAEAQAREARIETALERVRSRSLAMHKSEELKEVMAVVFERLKELGFVFEGAGIQLFTEGSNDIVQWVAAPDHLAAPILAVLPYTQEDYNESEIVRDMWLAKEKGDNVCNKSYSFDEKNRFFKYAGKYNDFEQIPASVREFQLQAPGYTMSLVPEKHSALWIDSYSGQMISADDFTVFKRIAKVFEQAYTRFLDLQRAEAQAREAQIEAALERVRSRSMAMQHSAELREVVAVVFQQMQKLGVSLNLCNILLVDEATLEVDYWLSFHEQEVFPESYHIPYFDHPVYHYQVNTWKNAEAFAEFELSGRAKTSWDEYLLTQTDIKRIGRPIKELIPKLDRVFISSVATKSGLLQTVSIDRLPNESISILQRFAKVFDQSYTRFLDLQRAEAQAIRAERDLFEIKAARQKAEEALVALKATQAQLVQKEKMASLGELTAGIAHEIQNPLNFVNNFSELNKEMMAELKEELRNGNVEQAGLIANDIEGNLEKVNHHGKRADGIVKGMLQHARASTGKKEPTDINKLVDESLRLSYQGIRARDKTFSASLETRYDETTGEVGVAAQDIGRVLLNLFNNAFYAVHLKRQQLNGTFEPIVTVSTKREHNNILIAVKDNGIGMSPKVTEKVFQPFFTTKPTGEGTGLGLSLSYDIVTKGHGGTIQVQSREGQGSEFVVQLPTT